MTKKISSSGKIRQMNKIELSIGNAKLKLNVSFRCISDAVIIGGTLKIGAKVKNC